jgi:hypothetical protein
LWQSFKKRHTNCDHVVYNSKTKGRKVKEITQRQIKKIRLGRKIRVFPQNMDSTSQI